MGSTADDDPEGLRYRELTDQARAGDPDIHLLSGVQDLAINALQQQARVVIQKPSGRGLA